MVSLTEILEGLVWHGVSPLSLLDTAHLTTAGQRWATALATSQNGTCKLHQRPYNTPIPIHRGSPSK